MAAFLCGHLLVGLLLAKGALGWLPVAGSCLATVAVFRLRGAVVGQQPGERLGRRHASGDGHCAGERGGHRAHDPAQAPGGAVFPVLETDCFLCVIRPPMC